jgi:hypothetical protein
VNPLSQGRNFKITLAVGLFKNKKSSNQVSVNEVSTEDLLQRSSPKGRHPQSVFLSSSLLRARICKPFREPRNLFPAWQNRFHGIESWAPVTFINTGSEFIKALLVSSTLGGGGEGGFFVTEKYS